MILARILLLAQALMSLVFGYLMARNPESLAAYTGLAVVSGDGAAELYSVYVGLSGALALMYLRAAFGTAWLQPGITLFAVTMSGIAVSRLAGIYVHDGATYTLNALYYDIPAAVLGWVAWWRVSKVNFAGGV